MEQDKQSQDKRTEEQIILQEPIMVKLGGKDYEIKLLPIAKAREWRKELAKIMASVPEVLGISSDSQEAFASGLDALFNGIPDRVIDLFFLYARDLDRDEIENTATEQELSLAFAKVVKVAFPLMRNLSGMMNNPVV